jgi:hypothetical protein
MATNPTTPSKVTSMGSQYSVSDDVTVPNPTPLTEALDSEVVDPPPLIDFAAMTKTLATIAEGLNESAEEAMYPSPPINTPEITSPAASVVYRQPARSRGFSAIGDRLAQLKIEGRKFAHHDTDMMSNSGRSVRSSMPADDESDGFSDMLSDGGKDKHDSRSLFLLASSILPLNISLVPIGLGSPRINPGIEGLISFTSKDLTAEALAPFNSTNPTKDISTASAMAFGTGNHKPKSQVSLISTATQETGVTEMSNWKEEVEGCFERAMLRLERLAQDEHQQDPSKPMEYYYEVHLKRLLGVGNSRIPVSVSLVDNAQRMSML